MNDLNENNIGISEVSSFGFLIKLKNLFAKLFTSSDTLMLATSKEILDEKEVAFIEKYGNLSIEQIQVLFEENKIQESELPSSKYEKLKSLYINQIKELDKKF